MRAHIVFISTLIVGLAVAGCGGPPGPVVTEPPGPHLTVVAKDLAFDTNELLMTADQPTLIYFSNEENVPHNIAIHPNKDDLADLFLGEIINRGAVVYDVPAMGPGEYYFNCTVHPNMYGSVKVHP